ncbi:MAG: Appr-1-p processing protein [Chloroflexi bacterium]|nr:Appr-1-p processing protein [Chloroflexota bacterium]
MTESQVRILVGDLFASGAQTLVNTVNCVGVMGKGVALGFRERYPGMYRDYVGRCKRGEVRLGEPYLWAPILDRWIINFPTKFHWRSLAKREDIVAGLEYLQRHAESWGITSLAVPPLGCGEGKLEWSIVGPTLFEYLSKLDIPVELYAPYGTPPEELDASYLIQPESRVPPGGRAMLLKVSPGSIALAAIVERMYRQPTAWPVGRTRFQKLAYFATQAGIPTGLRWDRGPYGPYASGLKDAQSKLENNGVLREEPGGSFFLLRPGPEFENAFRAYRPFLDEHNHAIDRVADLMLRLTTRQAEVAATVHFAATQLLRTKAGPVSELDVLGYVREWKNDRLDDEEVADAVRSLATQGWLSIRPSRSMLPEDFATAAGG